ncbi:MAG: hypothetical protein A3B86_03275 [Candidatus Yanofskybacteria bacterium RIFCSPHIGHO2_02_FULL_38_22b]|uniref:Uncharacterized protein n=1 Tax=Candidatus Yanofskybacteria bacterium RIFCSPHIGHO2_02_FULL_38_22b TaxID=1802673 RepID=A0A1F8F4P0_9BACT|nr:MAG: hypothetical protein A2816_03495 [Candidatus Yanofskybacteria bacterium RIFCSPHIGHO2_01_FULL_39_44]OGN07229.1 MAG: hypothetical protein A3B86_03275 [Candidatus Yanofskybacteria bacterium RIFCSPHIGHO2_02_FULL_38_22b]OGN20108.1 MAG: hypothetical protein A2910_01235 [Candidatus Yanofskybacteria bacterium RIFCSPLOWO2_01_FULL_39_28]
MLVCHNGWATDILLLSGIRSKLIGRSEDSFARLYRHKLPDGRVFTEFVQGRANVKSGLLIFVAFKDEQGNVVKESLWKESSMKSEV